MTHDSKRTVLITGCSDGGLGSQLCLAFHEAGWRVFAIARNLAKLRNVTEAGIETLQLDTLSEDSIKECVSAVEKLTGGSLDMLLNNAGAGYSMPLMDLDLAKTRELFELNTFSLISTTRAFLPLLRKSTTMHGGMQGGTVVNNTSCASLLPATLPFGGAYSASKAAATSFTEVLRLELEPFGIRVINLMTGSVRSSFHVNSPHNPLPPNSIYNAARDVIEKTISDTDYTADGVDPRKWARKIAASLSKENSPHWIWNGKWTTLTWLASFLPLQITDYTKKQLSGLDVVGRKIKEQERGKKA